MDIRVFRDINELSKEASRFIGEEIKFSLASRNPPHEEGGISVVLAGGRTPAPVYQKLADSLLNIDIDGIERIKWFFGDERWVEVSDPDSNEGMARRTLLDKIDTPESNIFSWGVEKFKNADSILNSRVWENAPVECALEYERRLKDCFSSGNTSPEIVLLGMGEDGHTASLFPDGEFVFYRDNSNSIVREKVNPDIDKSAVAVYRKGLNMWRLTLTPKFLSMARLIVFLIDGFNKREAFKRIVNGDKELPASWIDGKETVYFVTSSVYE